MRKTHCPFMLILNCCLLLSATSKCQFLQRYIPYDSIMRHADDNLMVRKGGHVATELSWIGLYQEALAEWDKYNGEIRSISAQDKTFFKSLYSPAPLESKIKDLARKAKIIIINEAHFNPRHRVVVSNMLQSLKEEGFNYLAAEAFNNVPNLNSTAHPTRSSGYYIREASFGNLIRKAKDLGFTFVGYEDNTNANGPVREINQATNIAAFLKDHPDAKILVYCGFSHVYEDSVENLGLTMAARLKSLTGIDPITIDQIEFSEKSRQQYQNPFSLLTESSTDQIIMMTGKKADLRIVKYKVDAVIVSSRTTYREGRPAWLFGKGKVPYYLKGDNFNFPMIVCVYKENDNTEIAVPIDVFEFRNAEMIKKYALVVEENQKNIFVIREPSGRTYKIE